MQYDISYLTFFSSKRLRIHTYTCIYRHIHTAYIQIWQRYRQIHADTTTSRCCCSGAQALAALASSSQPSCQGQALNQGSDTVGKPPAGHTLALAAVSHWQALARASHVDQS